jgi:DNA repair exonuclease SbcCD ATPase subunit
MKHNILFVIACLTFISCNSSEKAKNKIENEKDSLEAGLIQRDLSIDNYISAFNQIEQTLDSINIIQKNIYFKIDKTVELKRPVIDNINADVKAINNFIKSNTEKIDQLNKKLKNSNIKNEQLEKTVSRLNGQLTQKKEELTDLSRKLNDLNTEITELQINSGFLIAQNAVQADIIAGETADLHKAFYIVGTFKDLEKEKIIDQKGGLLGIGKTSKLSNDFDSNKFTKIDYTQTLSIPLNCKKIEIITSHPTHSFKLEKEKNGTIKDLIITNSEEFWKASKYLVVIKSV